MLPAISKLLPHLPRVFRHKVHTKPAPEEQSAASDAGTVPTSKQLSVRVVLLDKSEVTLFAKPSSKAKLLLDQVFDHVGIIEKEYFGLCIRDETRRSQWIDLQKSLASQLHGKIATTLYFCVKFYAADPCKLFQEVTRYQFFLQLKQDVLEGRLPVPSRIAAELASYAVQSELGDYDSQQHSPGYSSEFDFVPKQTEQFERRVEELHRRLVGLVPARAEYCYLDRIKWLDMYGVDLYPVQGEGAVEYFVGIAPTGILIYRNKVKISNHFWPRMMKVSSKGSRLVLRVKDKDNFERTYTFDCSSKQACKQLEQCCLEHHQFFRTNAASYSYQTTIKLFSADTRLRTSTLDSTITQQTPTFARRSSRRRPRRSSDGADITRHQSFVSLPPEKSASSFCPGGYNSRHESPTSVRSVVCTRRSYANSDVGCASSRKRHRHNCCTDVSDTESHASFASSRRPRWSESTMINDNSDCESVYSCYTNKSTRSSRRSHRNDWDSYGIDTHSVAGLCMRQRLNGSMTSMISAPEPNAHRRNRHQRRRKRLPPEELAQHFRYIDPVDVANEKLQSVPYTCVETDAADADLSPRTWQRLRQRQRKIHNTRQSSSACRQPWEPEKENCEPPVDSDQYSLRSRQSKFNSTICSRVVPSQYLQLPVSVQTTEMFTAPIVKIKRTDGAPAITENRVVNRSTLSSSSSPGASDLYDIHQVATKFTHSRIEHC